MLRKITVVTGIVTAFISMLAFSSVVINNLYDSALRFSGIEFDIKSNDINHPACKTAKQSDIEHILKTGVRITYRQLHDDYDFSITGCNVAGSLIQESKRINFSFDYDGGIMHLGSDLILACGEECCKSDDARCSFGPEVDRG